MALGLLCAPLPTVRQVCVTAIPQKTRRKSQKTQSDTLRCTERSRSDDLKLHNSKNSISKKELTDFMQPL